MANKEAAKKRALLNLLSELTEIVTDNNLSGKAKEVAISKAEADTIAGEGFDHEELCVITEFLISLEEHFLE